MKLTALKCYLRLLAPPGFPAPTVVAVAGRYRVAVAIVSRKAAAAEGPRAHWAGVGLAIGTGLAYSIPALCRRMWLVNATDGGAMLVAAGVLGLVWLAGSPGRGWRSRVFRFTERRYRRPRRRPRTRPRTRPSRWVGGRVTRSGSATPSRRGRRCSSMVFNAEFIVTLCERSGPASERSGGRSAFMSRLPCGPVRSRVGSCCNFSVIASLWSRRVYRVLLGASTTSTSLGMEVDCVPIRQRSAWRRRRLRAGSIHRRQGQAARRRAAPGGGKAARVT
jgi:hypothetical protein